MSVLWKALAEALWQPECRLSDSQQTLSGQQLLGTVEQAARELVASGVKRVASRLDNGLNWLSSDFALQSLGRVHVPLPTYFTTEQLQHALDTAGLDGLILPKDAPPPSDQWSAVTEWTLPDTQLWQRRADSTELPAGTRLVTFTSGTTARPKGVCLDDALMLRVARSLGEATQAAHVERHLAVLPLATLLEHVSVVAALLAGASVHLPSLNELGYSGASGLEPRRFLHTLASARCHSIVLVPQLLQALLAGLESGLQPAEAFRFVAVGGAPVAPSLLERADALQLPVYEGYGLSECCSVVALNRPGRRVHGTVGQALPHVQLRVDDSGELHVRGACMLGYVGDDAGTGADADGWLPTGDLVHIDAAGYLQIAGRRKHQFITAFGRNVNPEWVEASLSAQPPIAQAWVHGEALPTNVAVLVPRLPGVDDSALQAAVDAANRDLPDYARVSIWLRADQPFSLSNGLATANGRLRRDAILAQHRSVIDALGVNANQPIHLPAEFAAA